ncbi:flagellin N-terminal helical domain-containing protein [Sphingomonas sp. Leaf343]|uniref:flagellin N-terminal helical domain-containing protein n=1 Tax=Sphingomonas sp. Leaf343 TaxID=1736345 RepID=UPI0006FC5B20|nr:flagellar hook-associated protein 3 [Sphingomonas sp. Leaf343]KQR82363.1 flagellar hook-associated protein 3 [Sphingomonas sp. Leaf343]
MQISTASFYDTNASRISTMMARATKLQTEIATGKKVQTPSENPAVSQQLAELSRKDKDAAVYGQNLTLAGSLLDQADGVLGQIGTQIVRARELVTKAANGTETPESRKIFGTELASIVDAIVGLANTRNVRGEPLFGTPDGTPAVARDGNGVYQYATTNVSEVPIADNQSVQATESASRIFKDGSDDTLNMLDTLAKALMTGTATDQPAQDALDAIRAAGDRVDVVQASVGARGARVELQQSLQTTTNMDRDELRSSLEDTDVPAAYMEMQQLMTALSATQQTFSKLSQLSLFDYLR